MVKLQFYAKLNFDNFLGDVASILGAVPGEVHEEGMCVRLTRQQYEDDSIDLSEMVRDYGGKILHQR